MQHFKLQFWSCLKKNSLCTFTFTGLTCNIRQVCKRLTSETREVQICVFEIWVETCLTNQSSPRSPRPHPLPGGRQPDVWTVRIVFPPTLLGFYSFVFCFLFIHLVGAIGQNLLARALCLLDLRSNFHQKVFVSLLLSYLMSIRVVHLLSILLLGNIANSRSRSFNWWFDLHHCSLLVGPILRVLPLVQNRQ